MTRKNKTTVMVWMDESEKTRLRLAAAFEGVSMSEFVRRMIKQVPIIGKIEDGKVKLNGEG